MERCRRLFGKRSENSRKNDLKTVEKAIKKTVKKTVEKTVKKTVEKTVKTAPKSGIKISPKFADFYRSPKFGFSQFYHNVKGVLRKLPKTLCEIIVLIL